ncbi:hypothetical protein [Metabacillus bambusae]|uniref:Uncharacterized protein n=1 Tax=Metabacillus bambusae TaxID=2795218 RepID=A0ABS3N7N8_9BACI|nr:hypothetical protein [Metabacillus bambusae]MBO1514304.1 hypothetical protein [Metabacillus bambusae]
MNEKSFEMISDHAFRKVSPKYEEEIKVDTSKIVSDADFFNYVDKRIESARAHNERYTDELVKGIISFYENKMQD